MFARNSLRMPKIFFFLNFLRQQSKTSRVIMCYSPHRFVVWAAIHYHTRAWQTLKHGKECFILSLYFLAHLSQRLTRWDYSIPMVRRPSVVRRRPSSSSVVVHTFKLEYLWSQWANLDQILCVVSLGWVKGCIRFWGRLDQNSGFHSNRKPPLTYNGEMMSPTFLSCFWSDPFYTCK